MSYKNQMLKQVTNGKCDRRTYFNMINKKAHPRGRNQNQNDKSTDSIVDLIMGKKTFDDYNKDSNTTENEKNQLDSMSQNNNSNDGQNDDNDNNDNDNNNDNNNNDNYDNDNDINYNDDNDDNDNNNDDNNNDDNNNNNNNNNKSNIISHARKPNTSNKSIITVSMPSRLRKPITNRGNPYIMQNSNNNNNSNNSNNNNKLLNKIEILETKIIKLEAKIKILNLQMNSILENHN
ncbi:hypothetical protein QKC54_gp0590 [Megavirus baoshan]|uniref:Uncharacterized protein n=1 Tax=Megavirus baoshan TaxID=2496520 RepID=A0A3S5HL89_9VIRU|nr:hypothetical protein QKC54_gp0590 [Megavirus baoshan]AZL89244.1 hypothetical protein Mb0482 [Megavirus baoshan]